MKQNLHCHTLFCDGKNLAEDMVLGAIDRGMTSLGFSGHAPMEISNDWCIQSYDLPNYHGEIRRLQNKYEGQIDLYLGIEKEHLFPLIGYDYDYSISSVHVLDTPEGYCYVDESAQGLRTAVEQNFHGDPLAFARKYYAMVAEAAKNGDILGHFDLLTKFQDRDPLFVGAAYEALALEAMAAVLDTDIFVEINTGAIQRSYRTTPYPADFLLHYMAQRKANIILTTDAHCVEGLDFWYDEAVDLVKAHGFTHQMELTKTGFTTVSL